MRLQGQNEMQLLPVKRQSIATCLGIIPDNNTLEYVFR